MSERGQHREEVARARAGDRVRKVGYPIGIRELEVLRREELSPRMVRVTLGGPGIEGFESHVADEHIRLVFPDAGTGELRLPVPAGELLDWPRPRPPSRVYTVRRHDPVAGELDLDIVLHPGGLAADWAAAAAAGDRIHVAGPPGGVVVPDRHDRWLLAGDLSALPAIARTLETLPEGATGWAFIEATERMDLRHPPGVAVQWVDDGLVEAVTRAGVTRGERLFVWIAGESRSVAALRPWVRGELGVGPADSSLTGYWKRGLTDFEEEFDDDAP
jgi:NADPH-dependent ferric siderophore reductase